ncbi:MAG: hypothetical protein A3J45_13895 [Candidatus Rokubacteria bacterium RIFCSPHIGHO2_02_FULL_69_13]|nr:MAG: hypothetical protein A3J45_13895 [Candidatus Rokubacteria bacterium RIFCSPHIGHO2_02_FULL_69_13]
MPHLDDKDQEFPVPDLIHDTITTLADAIAVVLACEFFRSNGPGMLGERLDLRDDTLPLLLGGQGLDFLGRGRLDKELIGGHAA